MLTKVLIVDDMAIIRQPMTMSLKKAGYDVLEAASGIEALEIFRKNKPDIILLDVAMPGMDGLTLLHHLRALEGGAEIPVILLTAAGGRETVIKAARLGVREYMLKSTFSLDELLARVKKLTAPPRPPTNDSSLSDKSTPRAPLPEPLHSESSALPPPMSHQGKLVLLTREQTHARLAKLAMTRTCAGVVAQVMALANSPHSEIAELVTVIETDPILASRVLQLANSTTFRQRTGRLASIDEAVRNVGMRSIQNLVISIGVFEAFPPDQSDGFNTLRCWQHCFAVAAILRVLMAGRSEEEREHMALVGLCHDLGEIVLRQHFAREFDLIVDHAKQTGQAVSAVEAVALSMRRSELVNEVLTRIGLPATIAIPIMRFHEGSTSKSDESLQAVRLLQLANGIAHGLMLAPSTEATLAPFARADLRRACGQERINMDLRQLRNEVLVSTNILARLRANDEMQFMSTQLEATLTSVWYVRHPGYAELDPVQSALELLSRVRVEGRLPQSASEIECADVILVVSPFAESSPTLSQEISTLRAHSSYRGQRIRVLLGNCSNAVALPGATVQALPVSLRSLATLVEQDNMTSKSENSHLTINN